MYKLYDVILWQFKLNMNYELLQSLLILAKNYKVETFPLIHQKCKNSSPLLALANNVAKCAQWSEQINFNNYVKIQANTIYLSTKLWEN